MKKLFILAMSFIIVSSNMANCMETKTDAEATHSLEIKQEAQKYIPTLYDNEVFVKSLNNLPDVANAPKPLYWLIKPERGVAKDTVSKAAKMLDLIWSEPDGKTMLSAILYKRIPINITNEKNDPDALAKISANQPTANFSIPFVPLLDYNSMSLTIDIPESCINGFYDQNISPEKRIYYFTSLVSELGHAYMLLRNHDHKDSLEEELGVSMMGYNISYKIFTGKYLTKEQADFYSENIFISLLSGKQASLPIYINFHKEIQAYGLTMPYPDDYSDLVKMFKTLYEAKKVKWVASFSGHVY